MNQTQIFNELINIICFNCSTLSTGNDYSEERCCECGSLCIYEKIKNFPLLFEYFFHDKYNINQDIWYDDYIIIDDNYKMIFKIKIDKFILLAKQKEFPNNLLKLINIS